jgi:hypothetical protein
MTAIDAQGSGMRLSSLTLAPMSIFFSNPSSELSLSLSLYKPTATMDLPSASPMETPCARSSERGPGFRHCSSAVLARRRMWWETAKPTPGAATMSPVPTQGTARTAPSGHWVQEPELCFRISSLSPRGGQLAAVIQYSHFQTL